MNEANSGSAGFQPAAFPEADNASKDTRAPAKQNKGMIVVLASLRFYKRFLSPLLIPACRFSPTCSEYAYDAVSKYGVFRGLFLAAGRILRCNPFSKGGFDPVR